MSLHNRIESIPKRSDSVRFKASVLGLRLGAESSATSMGF